MISMRAATMILFAVGFAMLGAVEMLARREGSPIPRFGRICEVVMSFQVERLPVGRIALLGCWWWVGWHFLAR